MAHYKLNEADDLFLKPPGDTTLIAAGVSGAETWIERERDTVVRIGISAVAVATSEAGALEVCIDVGGGQARAKDGPAALEGQLRASQVVEVMAKAGERLAFRAYPTASSAQVLRAIVWSADLKHDPAPKPHAEPSPAPVSA